MSRTQKSEESIAEYVHALKQLARDCDFQAVTAENYRDELSRDAFISGISSANIYERLLEDQLTFQNALKKAEMLERAHKQSAYYADNPTPKFASAATTNPSL